MLSATYGPFFVATMDKFVTIYAVNSRDSSRSRQKLMQKFATFSEVIIFSGFALFAGAVLIYQLSPIYSYFIENELIPMFPLYFPLIDETTTSGFVILTIIHLLIQISAMSGTAAVDFMFTALFINILLLSFIFSDNIRELNDILNEKKVNSKLVRAKLRNILFMHREIRE